MTDSKRSTKFETVVGGYTSEYLTQRFTERTFGLFNDSDQLVQLAEKWTKLSNTLIEKSNGCSYMGNEITQGHMFEQLEVIKFNLNALKKDSDLLAKTTVGMGHPHAPADIVIIKDEAIVKEIQAKSCKTANLSANTLSKPKYDSMDKLLPVEQGDEARKYLEEKIQTNPNSSRAASFKDSEKNLQDRLNHEDVSSTGTTREEAINATDVNVTKQVADEFKFKSALTDMHESGKRAGNVGALLTGGISTATGLYSLHKGDIEVGELVSRVAVDSAKGYATGYVVTAMSKGLTHTATYHLGESAARLFSRSNAPVAMATGVVNASKSLIAYLNSEIDDEKLLEEISLTAITGTSSFYYSALGQIAIPIPVVGAMVGAGVGYFIGNMLHQSGLIALGDSKVVKEAKERRYAVQAMCLAAIPEIQKNRLELENYLDSYFSQRENEFLESFAMLDNSLLSWNPDEFVSGLERINNQFGKSLQFKSFDEFDELMNSDETFEF